MTPEISYGFFVQSFAASFAACFFSTLAGGGAGLILLPILIFLGLPFINALACHKLAIGFIGIGSTARYLRERIIDWKVFWWSAAIGVPFVLIGTTLAARISGDTMKPILGGAILVIVGLSLLRRSSGLVHSPIALSPGVLTVMLIALAPMAVYNGWLSAGAGIFTTLLYVHLLKYDQRHATVMTLSANGIFWNGVGAIAHVSMGHVIWTLAPALISGALLGSYAGASFGLTRGNVFLRAVFLCTATLTGALLLFDG